MQNFFNVLKMKIKKFFETRRKIANQIAYAAGYRNGVLAVQGILQSANIKEIYFAPVTVEASGNVTVKNCAFLADGVIKIESVKILAPTKTRTLCQKKIKIKKLAKK